MSTVEPLLPMECDGCGGDVFVVYRGDTNKDDSFRYMIKCDGCGCEQQL